MPSYRPFLKFVKSIRLPEYEYIGITKIEQEIIDTVEFQRLRRIRQNPGVQLVFPGASHTRFEHSLGAMHIAGEASMHILLNSIEKPITVPLTKYFRAEDPSPIIKQVQIARLAGLLHDVGHAPFSHTFEEFIKLGAREGIAGDWSHESLSLEIIYKKFQAAFDNSQINEYSIDPPEVMALICDYDIENKKIQQESSTLLNKIGVKNSEINVMEKFLGDHWHLNALIKGDPYNVDRFSYLILDSNRAGVKEYGSIDFQRLIQNLYKFNNVLLPSTKAEDSALRFFEAYSHMYNTIYLHKVARGADLHLAYAMYLAAKRDPKSIFGNLIMNPNMDAILSLTDDILIDKLRQIDDSKVKQIVNDFLSRKILTMVKEYDHVPKTIVNTGIPELSRMIKTRAGLDEDMPVIIDLPAEKKASKAPITANALNHLTFLDIEKNATKPLSQGIQSHFLLNQESLRVYAINDVTKAKKIEDVVIDLLK